MRALLKIHKTFSYNLYLYIDHAYFPCFLDNDIVDMEKPDGKCSPIFAVNKFLGLFSHSQMKSAALSDFWYWLNVNVLLSSKSIIILQKSFLCTMRFYAISVFDLKEWRQIRQQKSPSCLDVIPRNNVDNFFTAR